MYKQLQVADAVVTRHRKSLTEAGFVLELPTFRAQATLQADVDS